MSEPGLHPHASEGAPQPLADLLRDCQEEILVRWRGALRDCAAASRLPEPEFEDHLSLVLRQTIDAVRAIVANDWGAIRADGSRRHAAARLGEGLELNELVTEFFLLRHVLLEFVERQRPPGRWVQDGQVAGWAVETGIRAAIESFVQVEQRTLRALDRLSSLSVESRTLDSLLEGLLALILEAAPDVDSVAFLLREGDELRVASAVGLEGGERDFRLRIGEGFSGRIARDRKPAALREAAHDPIVKSRAVHERGIRALYGVPLIWEGDLVGVLHMGSLSVTEFSETDRTLLRAVGERAAAAIVQHRAYSLLSSVYETAPMGLAVLDEELRLTRMNRKLAEITAGLPPEAQLGRRLVEVLPDLRDARAIEEGCRRVLETGEPWLDVEVSGETPATPGELRYWITSYYPLRADRHVDGLGVVVQDVTERKRAERFQRNVLGIVGHELRDPLSTITMSAQLLLRSEERLARPVGRILSSATRMSALVRDLLDYSESRAGKGLPMRPRPADLAALCRLAVEEVEVTAPDREFRCEGPDPLEGEWDPDRLTQLLANLLRNAVNHGLPGTEIVVRWSGLADRVALEVVNHGAPVPGELVHRIFEPFQRGSAGGKRGLGLGLFIAREIARAHQGDIGVSSSGGLTAFRVTLARRAAGPLP